MKRLAAVYLVATICVVSVAGQKAPPQTQPPAQPNPFDRITAAKKAGRFPEALSLYLEQLAIGKVADLPDALEVPYELELRLEALETALKMLPPPPVPPAALEFERRGEQAISQNSLEGLRAAEEEFHRATLLAPWHAQTIFNLGVVEDKLGHTELAIANFALYLVASPNDSAPVRKRVAELKGSLDRMLSDWDKACAHSEKEGDAHACTALGTWTRRWHATHVTDLSGDFDEMLLLESACWRGDPEGCSALIDYHQYNAKEVAELYLEGRPGLRADAAKAIQILQRDCDNADSGCLALAVAYEDGVGVPKDPTKATLLYKRGCGVATASACYAKEKRDVEQKYPELKGFPPHLNLPRPMEMLLFQRLCDSVTPGTADACIGAAEYYEQGIEHNGVQFLPHDKPRAAALYQKACEKGAKDGCSRVARMYGEGEGVTKDSVRALGFTQRGCDLGATEDCKNAAQIYLQGTAAADRDRGVGMLQRACDQGDMNGCGRLALEYFSGKHIQQDLAQARQLYQKACDGGDDEMTIPCSALGLMYENGRGVPVDPLRAVSFYQRACDGRPIKSKVGNVEWQIQLREGYGCLQLARMYETGAGVPKDLTRARRFYEQGCDARDQDSCDKLKSLAAAK